MNSKHIESQFSAMGARFRTRVVPENRRGQSEYAMDIQRDRRGGLFELRVPDSLSNQLDVNVLQVRPRERHLLLLVRRDGFERTLDRFLCGHDEREWFIASVPERVSTVAQAMESLKPPQVRTAQVRAGLTAGQSHTRHNRAFRRQGEWFFIQAPEVRPDPKLVLRDEPIRRGGSKAHFVEMLYREGGSQVYVCRRYPNGVLEREYRRLLQEDPARAKWGWRLMQRDAAVYARGRIRHPDHRTITLREWHRVLLSTENSSPTMRQVAFLD